MEELKTYTTKANAKRAAMTAIKAAKLAEDEYELEIVGEEDFRAKIIIPLNVQLTEQQQDTIEASDNFDLVYTTAAAKNKYYIHETSDHGGVCSEVWAICDEMKAEAEEAGEQLRRKDVIERCREAGIAFGTARTQYQRWKNK